MDISRASPEDAYAIAKIHVDSWREAYRTILPAEYLAALSVKKDKLFGRSPLPKASLNYG